MRSLPWRWGLAFFLIFLFGVFRLQWDEVILWNWQELSQVPQGVFTAGGTVAAGGYVLFLLGDVRPEEKSRGRSCAVWEDCSCFWGRECSWCWDGWART